MSQSNLQNDHILAKCLFLLQMLCQFLELKNNYLHSPQISNAKNAIQYFKTESSKRFQGIIPYHARSMKERSLKF